MKNAIAWFEIPTTQLDRAQAFYEAVLGQPMRQAGAQGVHLPPGQRLSAIDQGGPVQARGGCGC